MCFGNIIFMPPALKRLKGHIALGLSVRASIRYKFKTFYWHDHMRSLRQGVRIWNFEEKKQQKTKQKNIKKSSAVFWLNEECP